MEKRDGRPSLSRTRYRRRRSNSMNINENGHTSNEQSHPYTSTSDGSPCYRRNHVRFRSGSSRSRSRDTPRSFHARHSINYRERLVILGLQFAALLHLCSVIYCHQWQPSIAVKYTIITYALFNLAAYICVQYDTQQAVHGGLLLGENPLLFLIWYGGLIGGGLALLLEKHKHLRSRAFTCRLRLVVLFNTTWPCIAYVTYVYRTELTFEKTSKALMAFLEAEHQSL